MGRALFLTEPAFREMLFRMEAHWHTARAEADSLLHGAEADSPPSLVHDVLGYGDKSQRTGTSRSVEREGAENAQSHIHNTRYAQPALLALELALAHVLQLRGVRPTASWGLPVFCEAVACSSHISVHYNPVFVFVFPRPCICVRV